MGKARSMALQGLAATPANPDEHIASPCLPRSCTSGRHCAATLVPNEGLPMKPAHSRRAASLALLLASMSLAASPLPSISLPPPPAAFAAGGAAGGGGAAAGGGKAADPVAAPGVEIPKAAAP